MNTLGLLKQEFITVLVLLTIIPVVLINIFLPRKNEERGEKSFSKGYQQTYNFLLISLFILIALNKMMGLTFEQFRSGVIICVLLSTTFLSVSVFLLNRKH